jgi:5,6-dimethylbenzimidazole synthase
MNDTVDLILHRRSLNSFGPDPVPDDALKTILQAACSAPYGGPDDPRKFFVVTRTETKEKLLSILKDCQSRLIREHGWNCKHWNTYFADAPVVIAVFFKPTAMGDHPERIELGIGVASAACSIENILLTSLALGLGAGWVGPADEAKPEFEKFFGVEAPWEFLALIPIGKPSGKTRRDIPKPVGDNVVYFDA